MEVLMLDRRPASRHGWRPFQIATTVPLLLLLTVTISILFMMKEATQSAVQAGGDDPVSHFEYSAVSGYFLQDDEKTDADSFDFKKHNFGLIERSYDSDGSITIESPTLWQRFGYHLASLNSAAPPATSYRLLFLGRHGQGYHNVAEAYYGVEAWDCYWAMLDGNGTATWSDARLTKLGIAQAQEAHDFWKEQMQKQKITAPESHYISPLDRAIHTAEVTFRGLDLGDRPYHPLVKEMLREGNGLHTCDRRSNRSTIEARWPQYRVDEGFTENDELWRPDLRESMSALTKRLRSLLDDIFDHDDSSVISLTAHSGTITAILRAIKHRSFALQTGGVIPVLVKVEKVHGKRPAVHVDPWEPKPDCEGEKNHIRRTKTYDEFLDELERSVTV